MAKELAPEDKIKHKIKQKSEPVKYGELRKPTDNDKWIFQKRMPKLPSEDASKKKQTRWTMKEYQRHVKNLRAGKLPLRKFLPDAAYDWLIIDDNNKYPPVMRYFLESVQGKAANPGAGHTSLLTGPEFADYANGSKFVKAAGQFHTDEKGKVTTFDFNSGHFMGDDDDCDTILEVMKIPEEIECSDDYDAKTEYDDLLRDDMPVWNNYDHDSASSQSMYPGLFLDQETMGIDGNGYYGEYFQGLDPLLALVIFVIVLLVCFTINLCVGIGGFIMGRVSADSSKETEDSMV